MAFDLAAVRRDFPHLESCTYLNTAAAGLSWAGQGAAAAEFYDRVKSRGYDARDEWRAVGDEVRDRLARLIGVPADTVGFVGSTTEAFNLVAQAIRFAAGHRVVLAADEFPAVDLVWESARDPRPEIVRVAIPDEAERTDRLAAAVDARTKVLAVSHVSWQTGGRVDLARLAAACRPHGARLVVDGIQAVGAVPVGAAAADVYCASVFKWLLSGFGLGFVAVGGAMAAELEPAIRGYMNPPPSRDLRYGHINYPGLYALRATLVYMERIGWDTIHQQVAGLARRLADGLGALGLRPAARPASGAGIVSFRHPDAATIVERLKQDRVMVEERGGHVRASTHFYNSAADVDRYLDRLSRLI